MAQYQDNPENYIGNQLLNAGYDPAYAARNAADIKSGYGFDVNSPDFNSNALLAEVNRRQQEALQPHGFAGKAFDFVTSNTFGIFLAALTAGAASGALSGGAVAGEAGAASGATAGGLDGAAGLSGGNFFEGGLGTLSGGTVDSGGLGIGGLGIGDAGLTDFGYLGADAAASTGGGSIAPIAAEGAGSAGAAGAATGLGGGEASIGTGLAVPGASATSVTPGAAGLTESAGFGPGAYDFGAGSGATFGGGSITPTLYDGATALGGTAGSSSSGLLGNIGNYLTSSSGLNTLGSLGSSLLQSNAAGNALNAQTNATNNANDLARYIYDTNRADNAPLLATRNNALTGLNGLITNPSSISSDPGYQFGLDQGTQALDRSAASKGGLYSGAQLKAQTRYGTDYGTTKLNDSYNRLSQVAGLGNIATSSNTNSGTNYANTVGNNTTALGNAQGANALYNGNLYSNLLNGAVSAYKVFGG